jgi:hypothetical protein
LQRLSSAAPERPSASDGLTSEVMKIIPQRTKGLDAQDTNKMAASQNFGDVSLRCS